MLSQYHAAMLTETLAKQFTPVALREIIHANVWQDSPFTLIDHPYIHADESRFAEAQAYIEEQHVLLAKATDPRAMRAAFGRLTHGAQDFYAHSNYVTLWLETHRQPNLKPQDIDSADPEILAHPHLRSGNFYWWRDVIFYIPIFKNFAKKYLVFANSHEELHLDDPSRGYKFFFAIEAAKQRTLAEYRRVTQTLTSTQLALFQGQPVPTSLAQPAYRPI